jgi:hypothetical protein
MKRSFLLTIGLVPLTALLFAQPAEESSPRASFNELAATIQKELASHGERVLGQETYRWSTRLEKMEDCRVELSVRVTNHFGDATARTESVNFSLGALEPYRIELKKSWLELPCAGREKCIYSTSTCSRKSKDGIVTDCASASPKRIESFSLEFDGDAASASRLEQAFHQAVDLCRAPKAVTF